MTTSRRTMYTVIDVADSVGSKDADLNLSTTSHRQPEQLPLAHSYVVEHAKNRSRPARLEPAGDRRVDDVSTCYRNGAEAERLVEYGGRHHDLVGDPTIRCAVLGGVGADVAGNVGGARRYRCLVGDPR